MRISEDNVNVEVIFWYIVEDIVVVNIGVGVDGYVIVEYYVYSEFYEVRFGVILYIIVVVIFVDVF